MRSLSPKVRAMVGLMTITVYGGIAASTIETWPVVGVVFAGLALLRVALLVKQWPRAGA